MGERIESSNLGVKISTCAQANYLLYFMKIHSSQIKAPIKQIVNKTICPVVITFQHLLLLDSSGDLPFRKKITAAGGSVKPSERRDG
ncbi:MAG: hypothetical protein C4530_19680 [Desulfobacteraceae bacterium]|nr:MAG: hypothetical protein C4530_19680 [Desulfobacteraceae bacterium]